MRILFIGTVRFSAELLQTILAEKAHVVGICTTSSSSFNSDHQDLSHIALRHSIPYTLNPNLDSPEVISWISSLKPDVIFCFGWSFLLKEPILNAAPLGVIGYHPAALPQNRGRHPIIWALVLGLTYTASTFFFMDQGADSGDILSQHQLEISPEDDAQSLYNKLIHVAKLQLIQFLPQLARNTFSRHPQDHSSSNNWRKRHKPDGLIDWRMSAITIHNLVRALTHPYIGAHFSYQQQDIKVWKSQIVTNVPPNLEPGKVLACHSDYIIVKAGIDAIKLVSFSPRLSICPGTYL